MSFLESLKEKFGGHKKTDSDFLNSSQMQNFRAPDLPNYPNQRPSQDIQSTRAGVFGAHNPNTGFSPEYLERPSQQSMQSNIQQMDPIGPPPTQTSSQYYNPLPPRNELPTSDVSAALDRLSRQNDMIIELLKEINLNLRFLRR